MSGFHLAGAVNQMKLGCTSAGEHSKPSRERRTPAALPPVGVYMLSRSIILAFPSEFQDDGQIMDI